VSPDASAAEGTVAPAGGEHLDDVHALGARALDEAAAAADLAALEGVRNRYLGRVIYVDPGPPATGMAATTVAVSTR